MSFRWSQGRVGSGIGSGRRRWYSDCFCPRRRSALAEWACYGRLKPDSFRRSKSEQENESNLKTLVRSDGSIRDIVS